MEILQAWIRLIVKASPNHDLLLWCAERKGVALIFLQLSLDLHIFFNSSGLVLVGRALKLISHNAVALVEFQGIHFSRILFLYLHIGPVPIEKSRRSWHACVRQGSMGPLSSEDQSFGLSRLFMLLHTISYVTSIGADPA
ncbi:hypothetical protein VI817_007044 [Penicillium citrinum]|nr:hypothetical protein VI817_007044 [Penicillium citrinum]